MLGMGESWQMRRWQGCAGSGVKKIFIVTMFFGKSSMVLHTLLMLVSASPAAATALMALTSSNQEPWGTFS